MHYSPPKDNQRLIALCAPLLVSSFLLFFVSNFLPYASIFQAVSLIMLATFIFLNVRFALSLYRYQIEATSLMVFRKQGRREEKLCDIELSSALALLTKEEFKDQKPKYALCYNFCQSFASENRTYFLFTFNDTEEKRALIIFEPSEEMQTEIRKYLKEE